MLVSWWIIPLFWIYVVGIGYLLTGEWDELDRGKEFTGLFWFGEEQ